LDKAASRLDQAVVGEIAATATEAAAALYRKHLDAYCAIQNLIITIVVINVPAFLPRLFREYQRDAIEFAGG
jgi:hypothetical protein